jgi:hypothetical protein
MDHDIQIVFNCPRFFQSTRESHIFNLGSNKSPMFAHLSTTLEGLFLIRLYKAEEKFDHFNRSLIDADHKALYSLLLGAMNFI